MQLRLFSYSEVFWLFFKSSLISEIFVTLQYKDEPLFDSKAETIQNKSQITKKKPE